MITKLKKLYSSLFQQVKNSNQTIRDVKANSAEVVWAHVFHDTIKGRKWLQELALSPGRMACNYSLLFVLTKILINCKPKRIIEFGLGETSKLISAFINNELSQSIHHIIEHDKEWISFFLDNHSLSQNSKIIECSLVVNNNASPHYSYNHLAEKITSDYDVYIIDGPFGSKQNSRLDIISIAERFNANDQFIIIFDDCQREGEKQTVAELIKVIEKRGITVHKGLYSGDKDQIVIATNKFRFITSL